MRSQDSDFYILHEQLHEQISTVPCHGLARYVRCYVTRDMRPVHGLRDSRAGFELTVKMSIRQRAGTACRLTYQE